ncbi:hypothetical protein ADEAN_000323700 [Angomonas deanei]|uniref:Uncharacterized protein n=1 Tax=Angomonas deanei TaxID=59799 RepID=A0A7G2C877_9TRYP|nr:hypothetical protein ADEAN_000323700 [Angomonas deanei]
MNFSRRAPLRDSKNTFTSGVAKKRPRDEVVEQKKVPQKPWDSEVEYKVVLEQKNTISQRNQTLIEEMKDLERSILAFYYSHMIHYEGQPSTEEEEAQDKDHDDASILLQIKPQENIFPGKRYAYYKKSELGQLQQSLWELYHAFGEEERQREADIEAMRKDVEETIYNGVLAEQIQRTTEVEARVAAVRQALQEAEARLNTVKDHTRTTQEKQKEIETAKEECTARIKVLEEKKRAQMENVSQIKEELQNLQAETNAALEEYEGRKRAVAALTAEVDRVGKCASKRGKRKQAE